MRDSEAQVRLGIYVNNRAAVFLGRDFSIEALIDLAKESEDSGFDFVSVGDSVLAKPRFSPVVTLAAIAAVTRRIELSTGILQPHLRNPVLLAQEWASLDAISGGRTSLGVGLGTGPRELVDAELQLVGLSRKLRARAFEESIAVLKQLWRGGPVSFEGSVYRLDQVDIGLRPAQPGGPSVIVACGGFIPRQAGFGPNDVFRPSLAGKVLAPLARVARLGDGWITGMVTPAEWRELWGRLRHEARRLGREIDSPSFERRLNCFICVREDGEAAWREGTAFLERYHRLPMDEDTVERWLIRGSPQRCAERIGEYIEAGVNSFHLVLASAHQREQLRRVAEEVRPLLPSARVATSSSPSATEGVVS